MRVREQLASGKPYRWFMRCFDGSVWREEHETGLLVRNYIGRRSERVYRNPLLPSLLGEVPSG